jgi:hypothetical protein
MMIHERLVLRPGVVVKLEGSCGNTFYGICVSLPSHDEEGRWTIEVKWLRGIFSEVSVEKLVPLVLCPELGWLFEATE